MLTSFPQTGFALLVSCSLTATFCFAGNDQAAPKTPIEVSGFDLLTPDEAATLLKKNNETNNAIEKTLFVDVRKLIEFSEEHIPGAIYVPYHEKSAKEAKFDATLDRFNTSEIKLSPAKAVVFYCNGEQCWKSYKACLWLLKEKSGKKIYWLRDGMPGWRGKKLPVATGINKNM